MDKYASVEISSWQEDHILNAPSPGPLLHGPPRHGGAGRSFASHAAAASSSRTSPAPERPTTCIVHPCRSESRRRKKKLKSRTKRPRGVHISTPESPTEQQDGHHDLGFGESGEPPRPDHENEIRPEICRAVVDESAQGMTTETPALMNLSDAIVMLRLEPNKRFAEMDILDVAKMKGFEFPPPCGPSTSVAS